MISILKNSEFEDINIIILYNDICQEDLEKVNKLKKIRLFTLYNLHVSDSQFKDFPFSFIRKEKTWYRYMLADKFPNFERILYLDCNTIIRKSLLPLWELNMNNELIAGVEDIFFSKDKAKNLGLKDNIFFNFDILLLNTKLWRKEKFYNQIVNYIKKKKFIIDNDHCFLNILADQRKILLNPEYNYIEINGNNDYNCQYDKDYLIEYKKKNPTIVNYFYIRKYISKKNNSYINEFSKYYFSILNVIYQTVPIVLSSDEWYAPFMYTAILSILKNGYSFYSFFILASQNFPKKYKIDILKLKKKYKKCSFHFIYMKKEFNDITMKIPHITLPTYYRLLIGDLLPKEFDKCIYLDVDICVRKDLSDFFNVKLGDHYLAGVVSASYFYNEKKNCKRLNLPSMKKYLNVGVLLMNLKQIRKDNMTKKFKELAKRNFTSQDQDVLNVACYGRILTLEPKYNAQVKTLKENNPLLRKLFKEREIMEAKNEPYIIHYSNKEKPWNSLEMYMGNYWWDIAKNTPYYEFFQKGVNFSNKLSKSDFKNDKKRSNYMN